MPSLDNNQLDDVLLLDGSLSFAGGQFSNARANSITEGGFSSALNMDYDAFGSISTRRGASQLASLTAPVRDLFFFDSTSGEYVAAADGDNKIKFTSQTSVTTEIIGSSYSGQNVYFAQLTDKLFFCDGVGSLQYITAGQTLTSISAGRITGAEITVAGRGYTSAPAISVSGGGSGATFSATLGPDGILSSITVTGQGTGYTQGAVITVGASPSGGTDAKATPGISQIPSLPKFLVSHTNRLFCASASTSSTQDTLYVSDLLDGESWDLIGNSIRVGGGDGDPITSIYPWYGFLILVFKERSIWVIDANPSAEVADWEVKLISSRVGCVAHKSVQQVGNDVFFLSREGVQSLSTIESGAQTGISLPISSPVHNVIEQINKSYYSRACAVYYRNRYLISFPTSTSTVDTTLVYNTLLKSWSGQWDGWAPRAYVVTAFGGELRMMFGDEVGKMMTWLDYVNDESATESYFLDSSSAYRSKVISKAYGFSEEYADKFGYQAQFTLDNTFLNPQLVSFSAMLGMTSSSSNLYTEDDLSKILAEGGDELTFADITTLGSSVSVGSLQGLFRKSFNLQSLGRWPVIQFIVSAESGRLSLQSIKASAFSDTIRPQL